MNNNPYRLCKCCGLYYELANFSRTKKDRIRYICKKCEEVRKEQAKIEWLRYQTEKRNEERKRKMNSNKFEYDQLNNIKKVNIEITSKNPNVNLNRIKSLIVNFDD